MTSEKPRAAVRRNVKKAAAAAKGQKAIAHLSAQNVLPLGTRIEGRR
jgi:hypothetical protein